MPGYSDSVVQPLFICEFQTKYIDTRARVKCPILTVNRWKFVKENCSKKLNNISFRDYTRLGWKMYEKLTLTGNFFAEIFFRDVCHVAEVRSANVVSEMEWTCWRFFNKRQSTKRATVVDRFPASSYSLNSYFET